jgi:AraC family transcriptional regulator
MPFDPAGCDEAFHVRHHQIGAFTTVHNRYPAGYALEEHEHEAATVYLVLSGSHTERSRRADVDCNRGSVVFSPRGARHSDHYGNAGGEAFLIELPDGAIERARDAGIQLDDPMHLGSGGATWVMQRLYDETLRGDDLSALSFEGLVLHLLASLRRDAARSRPQTPSWLGAARELMHDRFAERLSLAEVAATAGVHPVHFASSFHQSVGLTFGAYLRAIRVAHAKRALEGTKRTVAEIALECGFTDQSHLTRVFRELTGLTPARYRRIAQS